MLELTYAHSLLRSCIDGAPRRDPVDPSEVLAMQLVLNLPTVNPPKREDVLVDVARAVVTLCLRPDDDWQAPLQNWYGARIRKVARRSRNAGWYHVQDIPGVTIGHARAFVPGPVGHIPKNIRKLQVRGADLAQDSALPLQNAISPVIAVNQGLEMTLGKIAAQVGHASMLLAAHRDLDWVRQWGRKDFPLSVREVPAEQFERLCHQKGAVPVVDAGFTEVDPGSTTVVALEL